VAGGPAVAVGGQAACCCRRAAQAGDRGLGGSRARPSD
jgi:hypothetical protein